MPLANIEQGFIESLLQPQNNDEQFLSQLSVSGSLSPEKQLSIYRSNLNGAHQKVLGEIYPACLNILGENYFHQLCRQYRFQYPSLHPDLNKYGGRFSEFLHYQVQLHDELKEFNYLPDLATFEWHWHTSHFTENDTPFNFEDLQQVPLDQQPKIIFQLSKSLSLHLSVFPILEIWQANRGTPETGQEFVLPETANYYTIYRSGYKTDFKSLNKTQHAALTAIAGKDMLQQLSHAFADDFQAYLVEFIQHGWITGFTLQA